jgi:organic hydroperoxide reductase OsmC/OhrA
VSQTACYTTNVEWKGEHEGYIYMGNGPEMVFSAPPDAHGMSGVLTPEDAFVAAVNTCIMMMFLWTCERLKIALVAYSCQAVGTKLIELDHTETFTQVRIKPNICVKAGSESADKIERRIQRALGAAQKYSLVANSIKSQLIVEPLIEIIS